METISIETALALRKAGLSCLPAVKAQKRPSIGSWKVWAKRLPTLVEVEAWFANRQDGICVITGEVSGNLECIDFDNHGELFEAWKGKVSADLISRLVIERTPSGGYHVLYRSGKSVEGNLKLARGMREGKTLTLIETRGEGGLFLCSPTSGYELIQGNLTNLPLISAKAREGLLNAARSLDEQIPVNEPSRPTEALRGQKFGLSERPGDDFASRGDPRPYLQAAGWQYSGTSSDGNEHWTRPGKDPRQGFSATLKDGVFYVFSSNGAPFESGRGYNAFQVYTLLEHRGDFAASARTLLDKGYGTKVDPLSGVDLSAFNARLSETVVKEEEEDEDISIDKLAKLFPKMRPVLIHGFLRLGETMNVIAPPKTGKSWLVTDLALSVATGTDWFGFPCEQGKVLIIDNELHPETSAARIPKVIEARGCDINKVGKNISIVNQRGKLKSLEDIGNHIESYRAKGYKLIIIDAFYRAIPKGTDENDNGAIANIYNLLDRFAHEIGCAFCLIHHTSKGNQSQKSVTDVGAGAGSQSRAADTHVILRRHKSPNAVVMESVVRSFPSVEPVCLRWNWPLWNRDDSLNPEELEGKAEVAVHKEDPDPEDIAEKLPELVDTIHPIPKGVFIDKVKKKYSLMTKTAKLAVEIAISSGKILAERLPGQERGSQATKFILLPGEEDDEI